MAAMKEIHINKQKKNELIKWRWGTLLFYMELFLKYNGYRHEILYLFFFLNDLLQDEIGAKVKAMFTTKVIFEGVFERDWKTFWNHPQLRAKCKSYLNSRLCPKINFHGCFKYDFAYPWTDWEFQLAVVLFEEYQNLPCLAGNTRTQIRKKGFWDWSNTVKDFEENFPLEWFEYRSCLVDIPNFILEWRDNELRDFCYHYNIPKYERKRMFPNLLGLTKNDLMGFLLRLDEPIALLT